jgi:hypothetical protein
MLSLIKRYRIPNEQSKMDNPDKLATQGTQYEALETTEWAIKNVASLSGLFIFDCPLGSL